MGKSETRPCGFKHGDPLLAPEDIGDVRPSTYRIASMFIEREIDDAYDLLTETCRDELALIVEFLNERGKKR